MPVSASGEKARALLDRDSHLVVPVDVVRREGHEPGLAGRGRIQVQTDAALQVIHAARLAEKPALQS